MNRPLLVGVMGQTGSGKSAVAELLADRFEAQLVNADAFQVYRGLDIGTNKPDDKARYELLDVVGPKEDFGLGRWLALVGPVLERCFVAGRSVVVVGGTGLYVRALFEEYSGIHPAPPEELRKRLMSLEAQHGPERLVEELKGLGRAEGVDLKNPARVRRALEIAMEGAPAAAVSLPPFERRKFLLEVDSEGLDEALRKRVTEMFRRGWEQEVRGLLEQEVPETAPSMRAIGYQSVVKLVRGQSNFLQAKEEVLTKTRQYAKRQRTWFRKEPAVTKLHIDNLGSTGVQQGFLSAWADLAGRGD
ncbi:MAG: tRNA (adenosine(37)-N6)-dimethylallyltransferase MiaA [Armatimonadetes bacterium]|nr:tRNA (adenosine(37)-N6)-dimethylallyltransferase MiaA [Armatimonadota bacterium]